MPDKNKKPNPLVELLLGSVTGAITAIGESKLEDVLQDLHEKDPDAYKAAIHAGHLFVVKIQPLVTKSATKIDDAVLSAIGQAITNSAANNGITL